MLDIRNILHEWGKRVIQREFCLENLEEGNHLEYLGVDESIGLKRSKSYGAVITVYLAEGREKWSDAMKAGANIRFP
jgi:hypothetical protein